MKINLWYLVSFLCLVALLLGMFLVRGCDSRRMRRTGNHSRKAAAVQHLREVVPVLDTVKVPVILPIKPKAPVVVPVLTKLQVRKDLPRRQVLEKQTLILGMRKTKDSIFVQTINPKGIILENSYPEVYAMGKFEIDSTGNLHINPAEFLTDQRRARRKANWQKIWRTTKTVVISTLAAYGGYRLGTSNVK
jgi:hypothetical protein